MTMARKDIEALLPFLANGTLEGTERAEVEAAVAQDAGLAAELTALQAIRETMQSDDAGFSPAEMGLARLMRDLDGMAEAPAEPRQETNLVQPRIWQIAAAVLLAVALGQGVWMMSGSDSETPGYQLAGDAEATFTIAVRPDATEAQLRAVLLDAGVEIVSGPSALGLYGIGLLDGSSPEAARAALEAAGGVIETVDSAE